MNRPKIPTITAAVAALIFVISWAIGEAAETRPIPVVMLMKNIDNACKTLIYQRFKNRCTTYVQRFYNLSNFDSIKLSDLRLYSSIK